MKKNAEKITRERDYYIVKRNELITQSRNKLTAQAQKLLLYIISKVNPYEKEFTKIDFYISDYLQLCGLDTTSGKNYSDIKKQIKEIADTQSFWIELDENTETLLRLIDNVTLTRNEGLISLKLSKDLKPYLLDIKERFTEYALYNVLLLKSKYSVIMYEYITSKHYNKLKPITFTLTIDNFKKLMSAESYKTFQHIKEKIINIVIREINTYTDKNVTIEPLKLNKGKGYSHLKFTIETKEITERLRLRADIETVLNENNDDNEIVHETIKPSNEGQLTFM